ALLGLLIGDNCTLAHQPLHFASADPDMAELAATLARRVFGDAVAPRISPERKRYQVHFAATDWLSHQVRNPVAEWLDAMGVFNLRSHEKFIPGAVFAQPKAQIAHFLRHLWAADGGMYRSKKNYPSIYYATSNKRLATDIQALLLRLGLNPILVPAGREQYHVTVAGKDEMELFLRVVGGAGRRKSAQCAEVQAALAQMSAKTGRDIIPREFWQTLIRPFVRSQGWTMMGTMALLGNANGPFSVTNQHLSRERAARIAQTIGSPELERLA